MTRKLLGLVIVISSVVFLSAVSHADDIQCDWQLERRVSIEDGWIEVEQGRDENNERLRLAVWGPESIAATCEHLDDDEDPEVVVISRGTGTGPYYRLQIVDFRREGILTWSYPSGGMPRLEHQRVFLGTLPLGYQGAATRPVYNAYRYTQENGLIELADEFSWLLVITTTVNTEEVTSIEAEFSSIQACSAAGQSLIKEYLVNYQEEATFMCPSNREILKN